MPSKALKVFLNKRCKATEALADHFDTVNSRRGRNSHYSLLHGGLVLCVSSWEVYCEDVCREVLTKVLERATLKFDDIPEAVRNNILADAGTSFKTNGPPLTQNIAKLVGDGWKELHLSSVETYLVDFNTPRFHRTKGKNLKQLFRNAFGIDMVKEIEDGLEWPDFCSEVDGIISLRGEIAHTGQVSREKSFESGEFREYVDTFRYAAAAIDYVLYKHCRENYGFAPYQMTSTITDWV